MTHKEDWTEQQIKEMRREEAKYLDEVGSLVFLSNKRREKIEEAQRKKRKKNG